jgi:zinc transporter ZupT
MNITDLRDLPWDLILKIAYSAAAISCTAAAGVVIIYFALCSLLAVQRVFVYAFAITGAYYSYVALNEYLQQAQRIELEDKSPWWAVSYLGNITSHYIHTLTHHQ